MENQIVVNDYRQMDKILKEERTYLLNMCKKIKKTGCNVLLIQKAILRDAVNDLSLHFLSKLKILAIKDIERDEIEFICKVLPPPPNSSPQLRYLRLYRARGVNQLRTLILLRKKNWDMQSWWMKFKVLGREWLKSRG